MARKLPAILLGFLAFLLLGTVIVLSTTKHYLNIEPWAYITEQEVPLHPSRVNISDPLAPAQKVPRIIHQTWKSETLPERWKGPSQHCRELMSDYDYVLWTDAKSRELIAEKYPWFLDTYDGYQYNIQRADAIRYFVLHQFGGVYLDLDVGCIRPLDPLLQFEVILPETIPVGVSNDIMFSAKGHPFMERAIHSLITFDRNWLLNYPTVMFSTGPMFISAQYGLYTASHPPTPQYPGGEVRVLPKALYGKNAKPGETPHAFFEHYYGSSWHSDDAKLWTFLGVWGIRLMWVCLVFLLIAGGKLYWNKRKRHGGRRKLMFGRYEVYLPRFHQDRGDTTLDLGPFTLWTGSSASSPTSSEASSPILPPTAPPRFPVVHVPLEISPSSPTLSSSSIGDSSSVADVLRQAGTWLSSASSLFPMFTRSSDAARRRSHRRRRTNARNIMFFLPAIFSPSAPPAYNDLEAVSLTQRTSRSRSRSRSPTQEINLTSKAVEAGFDLHRPSPSNIPSNIPSPLPTPRLPPNEPNSTGETWDTWPSADSR